MKFSNYPKTTMAYKTRQESERIKKVHPEHACDVSSTGCHFYEIFQFRKANQLVAICTRCLAKTYVTIDTKIPKS